MKYLFSIFALLSFSINQEHIEIIEQVPTNDGITIHKKNNFPTALGMYENNKKNGLWIEYYDNGQIKSQGMYQNGLKDGLWTEYNYTQDISTIKSLDSLINNKTLWACCNHDEPMGHVMYYNESGEIINEEFINEKMIPDTIYNITYIDNEVFEETEQKVSNQTIRKVLGMYFWRLLECNMNGCIGCQWSKIEGCFKIDEEEEYDNLDDDEWTELFKEFELGLMNKEMHFGDSLIVQYNIKEKYFFERLIIPNTQTNSHTDQITSYWARPSIPIEEDEIEDEIIEFDFMDTDIEGFGEWGTPPPPRKERQDYVFHDTPPSPKGGPLKPKYPDICRQAGVEGSVFASFWIESTGDIDKSSIQIVKSIPCLDQAVIDMLRKSRWRPARNGRHKVGVPVTMEFAFSLTAD